MKPLLPALLPTFGHVFVIAMLVTTAVVIVLGASVLWRARRRRKSQLF